MKKVLKQTLSVLLAVVMTFTITLPAFAEESAPETQTEQDLSYNSSNALGDTIVNAIEDENAVRDEYDGKGIFNVSLVGLEATVALSAPDDCTVVVSVYEENTMQMVTSGKSAVSSDDMEVVVTLADFELPDFFVVKAFILNSENAPVCPSYVDLYNTKAYVESMSKTTEDFDSDLVINLDESTETNFAVVTDDAVVAQVDDEKNVIVSVDDEKGVYVIKNADDNIASLKTGEILYYTYGDGANDYILAKIGTIETKDSLTTIIASDDYEMSDFFDYIDIDTSKQAAPQTYGLRSSWDDEAGSYGDTKTFPISSGSAELKFSGEKWSLFFKVDGSVTFYVKFFYDFNLFSKDYYEFAYWVQVDASANVTFDFKAAFEKKVTLIDTDIAVVPGLDIHFALKFTVKAVAEFNATGTITFAMKNGASRNSDGEQQKIEQKPTITPKLEISGKVSISLIPEIETGFRIVKVFFVDLNVPVDFNITGTLYVPTSSEDKENHSCTICVDGKIKATVSLNISVKFGLKRSKAESIISFTAASKTVEFGSFYISGSGSGIKFGWGKCPNTYLGSGGSGSDGSGSDDSGSGGSGSDYDEPNIREWWDIGLCGDDIFYTLYKDGELYIGGSGAMYDYSNSNLPPWNDHKDKIETVYIDGFSITSIGNNTFDGCENLVSFTIPESITKIGEYAFKDCNKLKDIYYGGSKADWGRVFGYNTFLDTVAIHYEKVAELIDYFDYTIVNDEVCLESCSPTLSGDVVIPEEIESYPVTMIGERTFSNCDGLENVTIPDSVTTIGMLAFSYCDNLDSIIIPNSVTTIGAFAFNECKDLTSITIPYNVTTIGMRAFAGCDSLVSIVVDENNENYSSDEYGVLFSKVKNELIQYPTGNSRIGYIIPDNVTIIDELAFAYCNSLESVTIPDSVKIIGVDAFFHCDNLVSISLPDSISIIGEGAFRFCSFKCVTIPDSVTTIGKQAFALCDSLEIVIIGKSVTTIGDYAFYSCDSLTTVYYSGIEEQWNEISIGSSNNPLINADIIFNYTPSTVALMSLLPDNKLSAYSESNIQVKTISDAVIGYDYVMIAVKDENAEDLLAPSNLLYIDQKTAESEELTFEYVIDESITDYDVLVFGQKLAHYHLYNGVVTAPTCTEQGFTTYTCSCSDSYVADYIAATGHTDEVIPGYEATCTETGMTDGIKCSVCGVTTTEQEIIPVVAHNDGDKDGYCDECSEDLTVNCSHTCHSSGFVSFFWKIINFLQKLFGVKSARYCECGVDHWR